jgi:hypothetical protein
MDLTTCTHEARIGAGRFPVERVDLEVLSALTARTAVSIWWAQGFEPRSGRCRRPFRFELVNGFAEAGSSGWHNLDLGWGDSRVVLAGPISSGAALASLAGDPPSSADCGRCVTPLAQAMRLEKVV